MPTWNEINKEIDALGGNPKACDEIRQKYLVAAEARLGRAVIAYYSGFLQKPAHPELQITDLDMNGMMAVVHSADRTKGLDLFLHTPGGGIEATRAIVEYLYKMFGKDIRVIVPHMAMSAGTMIACGSREVMMGKHSCLGPTDPHIRGFPAMGILAEVDRAIEEIKKEPLKTIVWQQVFQKYPPAFIMDCERQVDGSRQMVSDWLEGNMLANEAKPKDKAKAIVYELMNYKGQASHGQHFLADQCRKIGLSISNIEDDQAIQEDVLSVHHAFIASFARTGAVKFIENSTGGNWAVSA